MIPTGCFPIFILFSMVDTSFLGTVDNLWTSVLCSTFGLKGVWETDCELTTAGAIEGSVNGLKGFCEYGTVVEDCKDHFCAGGPWEGDPDDFTGPRDGGPDDFTGPWDAFLVGGGAVPFTETAERTGACPLPGPKEVFSVSNFQVRVGAEAFAGGLEGLGPLPFEGGPLWRDGAWEGAPGGLTEARGVATLSGIPLAE
jgi:hypothetical protein